MASLGLTSALSRALGDLFHGAPNRRARRALGRKPSSTRPAGSSRRRVQPFLEMLEDRITPATDQTFAPTVFTDGVSSGGQINTLRDAINASNADGFTVPDHTDTIQLKAGTYTLNSGALSINAENHNLIIQGQGTSGPNATFIQQTVADRVFLIDDSNGNPEQITFKDLVIEGGNAQVDGQEGPSIAAGGGILAKSGEVTLSNVIVQNNAANAGAGNSAQGGGIYMVNGDAHFNASLTIQNSVIQDNSAVGSAGGIAEGGGVFGSGPFTISISNSSVSSNSATGGNNSSGGGGAAEGGGVFGIACTISISDSTLARNSVKGGSGTNGTGGLAAGGGVLGTGCTISISDSNLTLNTVEGGSGTINSTTVGNLSSVSNDSSTVTPGDIGGEAVGGGIWANGTTVISDCNLSGNTLTGGDGTLDNISASFAGDVGGEALGGGVVVAGGKSMIIGRSTLSNNILTGGKGTYKNGTVGGTVGGSASGGGIYVSAAGGAKPTITISVSTLSDNQVTGGDGSTVPAGPGFTENIGGTVGGSASGGGVEVSAPGGGTPTITISASTLSGNFVFGGNGSTKSVGSLGGASSLGFASGGGAGFEAGSFLDLLNSTIADNQAIGGQGASINPVAAGGGLFFADGAGAQLVNDTVVGNQASPAASGQGSTKGGGIDYANTVAGPELSMGNTLVALNGANLGPDVFGTVSNANHNLVSDADGSSGFSPLDGNLVGTTSHFLNPDIGGLANNGGSTQTIALLAGSPAINAGQNVPQSQIGPFDQRGQGFARVSGGTSDIGAFEVQQQSSSVVKPPPVVAPPSPAPPPTLHTPALLAAFDALLGGVETVKGDGTEMVIDSFFGIPFFVATYDGSGDLLSVTIFGINITFLFESL